MLRRENNKRNIRRLAREIRRQTGIRIDKARAIAVKLAQYRKWELDDIPKLKSVISYKMDPWSCSCCGPIYQLVVTGPKGSYTN